MKQELTSMALTSRYCQQLQWGTTQRILLLLKDGCRSGDAEAVVLPDPQDFLLDTPNPAMLTRVRKQLLQSYFMLGAA